MNPDDELGRRGPAPAPFTRAEILDALPRVEHEVADFFESLPEETFVCRVGGAWTPAEHLDHLTMAVRAIVKGLSVPPWLLCVLFGRPQRPSRRFEEVRETYRERLGQGARASAAFTPRTASGAAPISERRAELLGRWSRVNAAVGSRLERWTDLDLDRTTLPHPILKKITAREMLFFMLYHNQHHVAAARSRLPRG